MRRLTPYLFLGYCLTPYFSHRATLLKVRNTISSHVEQVFQAYEQHAAVLDIDTVLRPSVVSPSVADMLEWLQDIDRHYGSSYPSRAS